MDMEVLLNYPKNMLSPIFNSLAACFAVTLL